jgi:hypothetical protein
MRLWVPPLAVGFILLVDRRIWADDIRLPIKAVADELGPYRDDALLTISSVRSDLATSRWGPSSAPPMTVNSQ